MAAYITGSFGDELKYDPQGAPGTGCAAQIDLGGYLLGYNVDVIGRLRRRGRYGARSARGARLYLLGLAQPAWQQSGELKLPIQLPYRSSKVHVPIATVEPVTLYADADAYGATGIDASVRPHVLPVREVGCDLVVTPNTWAKVEAGAVSPAHGGLGPGARRARWRSLRWRDVRRNDLPVWLARRPRTRPSASAFGPRSARSRQLHCESPCRHHDRVHRARRERAGGVALRPRSGAESLELGPSQLARGQGAESPSQAPCTIRSPSHASAHGPSATILTALVAATVGGDHTPVVSADRAEFATPGPTAEARPPTPEAQVATCAALSGRLLSRAATADAAPRPVGTGRDDPHRSRSRAPGLALRCESG